MRLDNTSSQRSKREYRYIGLAVIMLILILLPSTQTVKNFLIHKGYVAKYQQNSDKLFALVKGITYAPLNYIATDPSEDVIKLDIKYQDWLLLEKDRETAFKNGVIAKNRNIVNANIFHNNIKYKAKVRLQGDMLDHINSPIRWSLRFELKQKKALFSAKRFALLSPHVRIHQGPILFSKTMEIAGFDIISPQYKTTKLIVNGVDWGVMFFEPAFSQSLLATNHRTEGLIVRLDLSEEHQDKNNKITRTLKPRVIQKKTILKNNALANQRQIALQLVDDFLSGKRLPSEVFDVTKLSQYLATVDLWGAWHALTWNNWRWYYNPHTALLEPIQSDVSVSPAAHHWLMQPPTSHVFLSRKMLADPIIKSHYQLALDKLKSLIDSKELLASLNTHQQKIIKKLHTSAPLTPEFDLSHLTKQIACIYQGYSKPPCNGIKQMDSSLHLNMSSAKVISNWDLVSKYSSNPNNQLTDQLTVNNNNHHPINLKGLSGITQFDEIDLLENTNANFPQVVAPKSQLTIPISKNIKSVVVRAATQDEKFLNYQFNKDVSASTFIPRPASADTSSQYTNSHPFINITGNSWVIPAGIWEINDYLVTPQNWNVTIEAGAKLKFSSKAGLMVFGDLLVKGTAEQPIMLEQQAGHTRWAGISVFGNSLTNKNTINHLIINNAGSPKLGLWQPRGALMFINTSITINNLRINDNQSEDALNIINSNVDITALHINNTLSDAFDCDFCNGKIKDSLFTKVGIRSGGDGIDVSGSNLTIENITFNGIRDKAISGGENSYLVVKNTKLNNANFGIVAKDATKIIAADVLASNIKHHALMSYSKKSIFGSAELIVSNFVCEDHKCNQKISVEEGSKLVVNGKKLFGDQLDVKNLYRTIMKSDKPK